MFSYLFRNIIMAHFLKILKSTIISKVAGILFKLALNTFNSINSAILKEMPTICEIGVSFTL